MTTPAQPPAKKRAITPMTMVIVLGVALAGGAFFLWRQKNSSSAANASTADTTPGGSLEDFAGQVATLQTEIADLQSSAAQDEGQESGTGTTPSPQPAPSPSPSPKPKAPGMPANVSGSALSATSVRLTWAKVAGATSYQAHATYQGKALPVVTVAAPPATLSGLTANHTYTCHVKACNSGGCSAETNGPVVKTKAK